MQRSKEQLHFNLSEKLIKQYKFNLSHGYGVKAGLTDKKRPKSGLVSLQRNDAVSYGVLEALLITNLRHVIEPKHNQNPVVDEAGNIYRELSPTALTMPVEDGNGKLSAPLPTSIDSVTRAFSHLKQRRVFHEHPVKNNFYTLVCAMKH